MVANDGLTIVTRFDLSSINELAESPQVIVQGSADLASNLKARSARVRA